MNNALTSFVIISNSLNKGVDSIEALVPFVLRLIDVKNYSSVSVETVCKDFADEYGLQIPRHPMETIINRMRPRYIKKEARKIVINKEEIRKRIETIDFEQAHKRYNWLLENFIDFCRNYSTPIEVSREEADNLFISLLKGHDADIIFAAYVSEDETESLIPDTVEIDDSDKIYLLNKYVNGLLQKGGEYAEYLIDSAVGHKFASVLLYREFSNVRGTGACANYYLDVGILFDLTGINQAFRKKAAEDLLSVLREKGSSLWIFRHNYEEFRRIVEGTLNWIENHSYDAAKASRTLQHFKDEGYGIAEVRLFISQIDSVLERNHIKKGLLLDPNKSQIYQIERSDLQKTILEVYNSNGKLFDFEDREDTLELDELSIENIYKLRKGSAPTILNDAGHVFLTTNTGLAFASNKFEQVTLERGYFTIPAVLTDTFVGTFVWIQEPTKLAKEFNRSKMISFTNAALQPRASLMNKFALEVNRAKKNELNPISSESAYLLLTSNLPRRLLADKTLGDPNRITAQTPYEVLAELEAELVAQEKRKTDAALKEAESERREKASAQKELRYQVENTKHVIDLLAQWGKWIFLALSIVLALIFYGIAEFGEQKSLLVKIMSYSLSVIILFSGITIAALGKQVENWIRTKLTKLLLPVSND
jgi:hypothetical protein